MSGKPDKIIQYSGHKDTVGVELDVTKTIKKVKLKDYWSADKIRRRCEEINRDNQASKEQ